MSFSINYNSINLLAAFERVFVFYSWTYRKKKSRFIDANYGMIRVVKDETLPY